MTIHDALHDFWHTLKATAKKAWSAVGFVSASVLLAFTYYYKDVLHDRDIPQWIKDFNILVGFPLALTGLFTVILATKLIHVWREKSGHVHVPARETVTYHAHTYRSGKDLRELSAFAHKVFKGDTMKAEMVDHAVKTGAATGLRLTDAAGKNVGFLDVFHFTEAAMEKWMNGDLPEDALRPEDFRKIPARGRVLDLAIGAIYVHPGAARGVAHQFANAGELFLRKTFSKFHQINLYATIFAPDGKRIAEAYKFAMEREARKRTGRHANGHDLRLKTIDLNQLPHLIGGVGGQRHVVIEMMG